MIFTERYLTDLLTSGPDWSWFTRKTLRCRKNEQSERCRCGDIDIATENTWVLFFFLCRNSTVGLFRGAKSLYDFFPRAQFDITPFSSGKDGGYNGAVCGVSLTPSIHICLLSSPTLPGRGRYSLALACCCLFVPPSLLPPVGLTFVFYLSKLIWVFFSVLFCSAAGN